MARPSHSDSEDERTLRPSDDEVLQEEEDTERLLRTPKPSRWSFLPWSKRDPHSPRHISLSPEEGRPQGRKQRRMRRRRKRRTRGEAEGEALMYEMQDRGKGEQDDSGASSSEDEDLQKPNPRKVGAAGVVAMGVANTG